MATRLAGALYLVVIAGGIFVYGYVPAVTVVAGDAAGTARNILAHEALYRSSIAAGVLFLVCNVPLAAIFYELFQGTNRIVARTVAMLVVLGSAIEAVGLVFRTGSLFLLRAAEPSPPLARIALRLQGTAVDIGFAFFALYCLLLGWMILRSGIVPKAVGALMIVAGLCYGAGSLASILGMGLGVAVLLPCFVAELSFSLTLLFGKPKSIAEV